MTDGDFLERSIVNMELDEKKLIQSAIAGNHEDFKILISSCLEKTIPIIQHQYHVHQHDINDIAQVVSIKIWENLKDFRNESSFFTWFFSIFKHQVVNFVKKQNYISKHEVPTITETNENGDFDYASSVLLEDELQETADKFLQKKEEIQELQAIAADVLGKLNKEHREVLALITMEDKSYEEASKILNIPIGTVMSRFFYAKKNAKKILHEYTRIHTVELPCLGERS